jgi:lipopolysaccharide transport system permease protein
VIQIMLLLSPIGYTIDFMLNKLSEPWKTIYQLNPMAGVAQGFRWALTGEGAMTVELGVLSAVSAVVLLALGFIYFKRTEIRFADVA